ncbi:MAG TPA: Nif3-like dinuclear metal center hexameric protein [Bacilli bacterium]|nr:Nif3-like dinuclear metal center hexameric protein [Bacilli bacterium]
MNFKSFLALMAKRFPKRLAEPFDRVGLMTGQLPENVNKVLLCLDLDWELLPMVKQSKPDFIITHHPFIFGTKYQVFKKDESKRLLCEEIDKLGIPVYSFHTNFDAGVGGMNDALTNALGLKDIYTPIDNPMMRIGFLEEEMDIFSFASYAKHRLDVNYGLLIHEGHPIIGKVGIIGGGGSRDWEVAQKEGCDIYISGDVPHHVRRDIVNAQFNYLDLPHEIEKIFMPTMEKYLLSIDKDLVIQSYDHERLPKII